MATYVSIYPSANGTQGSWNGTDAWFNTGTYTFGQPLNAGDTALILDTTPTLTSGYINGPTIWLSTGTYYSPGLTATDTVFGGNTTFYLTGGTTSTPQIQLNDSIIYGNIYAQEGTSYLSVESGDYGASYGTIIIGGLTAPTGGFYPAALNINEYGSGSWSNIGNMYVFADGTGTIASAQPISNYGAMAANDGTLTITEYSPSVFGNAGQIYAANAGTVTIDGAMAQNGGVTVDNGTFVLDGTTSGNGIFNLEAGKMEFMQPFTGNPPASTFATSLTSEFTGASFNLEFPDSFSSLTAAVSGHSLVITGSYGGTAATLTMTLDTAHAYSSSQFTTTAADANGFTHVIYTA